MADADDPVATQLLASPGKDKHTTASPSTSSHSMYLSRALSSPLTAARANPNRPLSADDGRRQSLPLQAPPSSKEAPVRSASSSFPFSLKLASREGFNHRNRAGLP